MIFLRPVFFTASTTRVSSHVLMNVRSNRFLLGEDVLKRLHELAAAIFQHRGQDGRDVENLGGLGQRDDVVHDHRRLVAVQVGELKGLVVDQDQHRLFRGQEGVQAVLEDWGLGHGVHSGLGLRCFRRRYRHVYCCLIRL